MGWGRTRGRVYVGAGVERRGSGMDDCERRLCEKWGH